MNELLKRLGLPEEQQAEILAAYNKDLTLLEGEKNTLVSQFEAKEKELNEKLEGFKDYEDIKADLLKTKEEFTGFKQKFDEVEKDHAIKLNDTILQKEIEKSLLKNNVKYADLLISKFDKAALNVKDGIVEGLDKQVEALKANYPDCFNAQNQLSGSTPAQKTHSPEFLDVNNMTAEEIAKNWDKIKKANRRI